VLNETHTNIYTGPRLGRKTAKTFSQKEDKQAGISRDTLFFTQYTVVGLFGLHAVVTPDLIK
jgi:hypothetical protein